jgi:hypothetical protein
MAGVRHAVAALLAVMLAGLLPHETRAQSCHVQPLQELREGWLLTLRQETARFESSRYDGHYQGLILSGGLAWRQLYAGAALSAYRIVRNGLASRGVGDSFLQARATLLGAESATAQGGLAMAATLPTGDARADLGMGHVMLMPGAWATASLHRLLLSTQLGYGKSLAGNNGHQHRGVGPLIAPMSLAEIDATLAASVPFYPNATDLRLKAEIDGALPTSDEGATARANLRLGVLHGHRVKASIDLQLPIAGEPSTLKLVLMLGVGMR